MSNTLQKLRVVIDPDDVAARCQAIISDPLAAVTKAHRDGLLMLRRTLESFEEYVAKRERSRQGMTDEHSLGELIRATQFLLAHTLAV